MITRAVLAEVAVLVPAARLAELDIVRDAAEAQRAGIRVTPTVVVTRDDGTEVFRAEGRIVFGLGRRSRFAFRGLHACRRRKESNRIEARHQRGRHQHHQHGSARRVKPSQSRSQLR